MDFDNVLLNVAYVAYVGAGLVPSGFRLRVALVVPSVLFIAWGIADGSMTVIAWNVAFAAVNIVQAIRIARRNSVVLEPEEEATRLALFEGLSRRDFLQLWSAGRGHDGPVGTQLCGEGVDQRDLLLLLEGEVHVTNSRGLDRHRTPLSFIGEMSFFSGEAASADVVASTPIRYRSWDQDDLRNLQTLNDEASRALTRALGRDVAAKLRN